MNIEIHHWANDKPKGFDVTDFFENGGTAEDFKEMLKSAGSFEITEPVDRKQFNLTDSGNAELLVHLCGNKIRYNHTTGKFFEWNEQYWVQDNKNKMLNLAIKTARHWKKLAQKTKDPRNAQELFKHGLKSEGMIKLQCMIEIAKSHPTISTLAKDWNQNFFLLQFTNGTLNLKTINFSPGKQTDLISRCVGFKYDKKAKCPIFRKVIREIFKNDLALIKFFQRAVGYSLTGDVSEQCFFLLYGIGANGKTIILEIIKLLLGDYATNSSFSTFEKKRGYRQSNDIARLNFVRLVTASECGINKQLDEERLKTITGGDSITSRFLFKEFFTFIPRFKLWLAVNSLPVISDFSYGFWRRVRLIPFEVQFLGIKDDKQLAEKFKTELPGIMNWALKGLIQWKKMGLNPPRKVIDATQFYHKDSDVVTEFLDEFAVRNPKAKIKSRDLYQNFCAWYSVEYTKKPLSQTAFGRRVKQVTGIESKAHGKNRRKTYIGLDMKDNFSYYSKNSTKR